MDHKKRVQFAEDTNKKKLKVKTQEMEVESSSSENATNADQSTLA